MHILQNGYLIQELYSKVKNAEVAQRDISSHFEYVGGQQTELSSLLDSYEQALSSLPDVQETERDKAFGMAETLAEEMDHISDLLRTMIEEMNQRKGSDDTTVGKVVKVMNHHYTALKQLEGEMVDLERMCETVKREQVSARIQGERMYGRY